MARVPVKVLKKKITSKNILYKMEWENGSITYEPLADLTPQMMPLI